MCQLPILCFLLLALDFPHIIKKCLKKLARNDFFSHVQKENMSNASDIRKVLGHLNVLEIPVLRNAWHGVEIMTLYLSTQQILVDLVSDLVYLWH